MRLVRKANIASFLMLLTPVIFFLAAWGMLRKQEPFYSWFYSFAWWSYILFLEAFLFSRGAQSDLFNLPRRFFILLPLSVTIWLIFEAFNFRLGNWHYIDLPLYTPLRWFGYTLSFSTVLPGIFTTMHLLKYTGISRDSHCSPLLSPRTLYLPFVLAGAAFFLLPLVWPQYFFPFVWGTFVFLLEPINHRYGSFSFLEDWQKGSLRNFYVLLLAGACCGFFWEFWNYWAGSKWIYTVPFVGWLKIFEMPILGFLGFPPFAVECYVMVNAFFLLADRINNQLALRRRQAAWALLAAGMVFFDILIFIGIDHLTVISFK